MAGFPYVVHNDAFAGRNCLEAQLTTDAYVRHRRDLTRIVRAPIGSHLHMYLHPLQPSPSGGSTYSPAVTRTVLVRRADYHLRSPAVRRELRRIGC